jgi:hypothetical protein
MVQQIGLDMERRHSYLDLKVRANDNSRFTEERSDGKLSRYVLESSGRGNPFTDFNGSIGHSILVGTERSRKLAS